MFHFCLATPTERKTSLPGDSIVAAPFFVSTHAVTIAARRDKVWPWLVQIGQDRGGFYSYTVLENLFGCRMKNAAEVRAEWQELSEGDAVQLHPRFRPLIVRQIRDTRTLLLEQQRPLADVGVFAK